MIRDAEFWAEVRRKSGGGDPTFKSVLGLLHARQVALDAASTSMEVEEHVILRAGAEEKEKSEGRIPTPEERHKLEEESKLKLEELRKLHDNRLNPKRGLRIPNIKVQDVAPSVIRILQQVMMFAVPIYSLRYNVPAMSMSWETSCFVDRQSKQLVTFGAGNGVKVPQHLRSRGCIAGDGFFALLTDQDDVWASGGLKVSTGSGIGPTSLGREDVMIGLAGKVLMLSGHGMRLAGVTRAFTVRPLSVLSNPTKSIIPSRHVRFVDLGYGEEYYMVGTDSKLYKTNGSKKSLGTPRRAASLSHIPVSRIATGLSFLLIIDQNGHLYTLGRNKKGQLGNGQVQDFCRKAFLHDKLKHHFFVQVAAGTYHSLALTSSGIVYGAGCNESGQLGLGESVRSVSEFTKIPLPGKCISLAAGPVGSMFACEDGQVLTCGLNDCMQLGLDTPEKFVYTPRPVQILTSGVESYTLDYGGWSLSSVESHTSNNAPRPPLSDRNVNTATRVDIWHQRISKDTIPITDDAQTPFADYDAAGNRISKTPQVVKVRARREMPLSVISERQEGDFDPQVGNTEPFQENIPSHSTQDHNPINIPEKVEKKKACANCCSVM